MLSSGEAGDAEAGDADGWIAGNPRRRLPITLVVIAVVLVFGVSAHAGHIGSAGPTRAVAGAPLDLTHPFANTPAANWPDGTAGIQPPAATPVGGHRAAEVADALDRARQALTAAHLDTRMLVNHDPTDYLALLAVNVRGPEQAALTGAGPARDGGEVTMIATGFTLLPIPVKVSGGMSVSTDQHDQLVVHANYVFAYPFAPADSSSITVPGQIVAVQHVQEDFTVVRGTNYAAGDRGLWPTKSASYYESMACGASERGYLAPEYSEPHTGRTPAEDPDAYYAPSHPMTIAVTCT